MKKQDYEKARKALYDSYGGVKRKKFVELKTSSYEWEDRSAKHYASLETNKQAVCGRTNMMEPMILLKESPEVQEQIIKKASRLVPQFNKGAVQYTPDEQDPADLGRKR